VSASPAGPLLPPAVAPLTRSYVAVGWSTRERKGAYSKRLAVPLVPPPPPPAPPAVTYDEKAITLQWGPPAAGAQSAPVRELIEVLPSHPLGPARSAITYNVYDSRTSTKLTEAPIAETTFADQRIAWGEERCYVVRAVATIADLKIESGAAEPACVTLKDTFPPAAPANLQSSPAERAINLIWDASAEPDLAGYIVLRGDSPATLKPLMTVPIRETTFRDDVQPGIRFVYAVKAVDRAGNESGPSRTVEEAARE
jgi:hypothetical protein